MLKDQATICRSSEQGIKDHLNENLKKYVHERIQADQLLLKDWTKNMVAEQVQTSQSSLRELFNKQLNDVKRMFTVPGVIGAEVKGQVNTCRYSDFKEFVTGINETSLKRGVEGLRVTQLLKQTESKMLALDAEL